MMSALESLKKIAKDYQLQESFPDPVMKEVGRLLANPGLDDPKLVDLTALPFVTIDHETSMDLDQAAFVETSGDGFQVHYALADAAFYISADSALFREALARAASYYFPGFMVPMLPRELSEGLVSLNPNVDRRAMVFSLSLDASGGCTGANIRAALIRSKAKLSFVGVQDFLDGKTDGFGHEGIEQNLRRLKEVGLLRMRHAKDRNVVRYRRSEVDVHLGDHGGARFVVNDSIRVPVERYNEQLSLLCNVEGAKFLQRSALLSGIDPVYRVHPPPEIDRVEKLEKTIAGLVKAHKLDSKVWLWKRDEQDLSDYLEALPEKGAEGRIASAIHRQAVMINGRSSFRATPGIHHGVGAVVYARFSAPMREIVGIFLHKETWEAISGGSGENDESLRKSVVEAANRAKKIQRDVTNQCNLLVLDQMFQDDLKASNVLQRSGTIMGMQRGKAYVLLDQPPIDVKVYLRHLVEEQGVRLSIDETNLTLTGGKETFRIGDAVNVSVRGYDESKKRWKLSLERCQQS